jgi:hypothetical protein
MASLFVCFSSALVYRDIVEGPLAIEIFRFRPQIPKATIKLKHHPSPSHPSPSHLTPNPNGILPSNLFSRARNQHCEFPEHIA